jgi:hypothetical protein
MLSSLCVAAWKKTDLAHISRDHSIPANSFYYSRIAQSSITPFLPDDCYWPGRAKAPIIATHLARQPFGHILPIPAGAGPA